MMIKQVLIFAFVTSIIDQFNVLYIKMLIDIKCAVYVACYFAEGNIFINKVFGNLVYNQNICEYKKNYSMMNLKESIALTESKLIKRYLK